MGKIHNLINFEFGSHYLGMLRLLHLRHGNVRPGSDVGVCENAVILLL